MIKMKNIILKKSNKVKHVKNESLRSFWERNRLSEGYLLKKTIANGTLKFCRAVMLFGLAFLILQPILSKISVSFMEERDLYDATVINIPRNWTLANYELSSKLMNYPKSLISALLISLLIALVQLASTTLVAYGFARYNFPGKRFYLLQLYYQL